MPQLRRRTVSPALVIGLAATLAGCGGGDPDPIDPFVATFAGFCHPEPSVVDSGTGAMLYGYTVQTALSKTGPNLAMQRVTAYFFVASDCSGPLRTSMSVSGRNTWLRIDGNESVGGNAVDKVTVSQDDWLPGAAAGAAVSTPDGVTYGGNFLLGGSSEDLCFIDANGYLYGGDFSQPPDASGYPSALSRSPVAQRR